MRTSQHRPHLVFAILMATLLALPVLGLLSGPSASAERSSSESTTTLTERLENSWKTGLIEGAFLFNKHLSNFDIATEVRGNTAMLKGSVATDAERALAEQVALSVEGIDDVENELTVDEQTQDTDQAATDAVPDSTITTRVKSQLLANQETRGLAIDVNTNDQIVTLTGEVNDEVEKELAYYIARNTGGVRRVVNELAVTSES